MPRTPEQEALKKKWAKINSSIADQAILRSFGNFLYQNELVPQQTVTSTLNMNGIDDLTKVGRLMGVVQSRITTASTLENAARYYNKFVLLVHDDLHLTDLAIEMVETCKKCYAEVNLPYSSPLAQGSSAAAHQATGADFSIWDTEISTTSHLTLVRYQDPITGMRKELRILDTIAPMWQSIAGIIGLPPAEITGIQSPGSGKTPSQCINGVITEWLQRAPTLPKSGRYPNTWRGLYNLLVDSKYGVAAKDLKDSLDADYSDFHMNMDSEPGGRVQTQPQPPVAPVGGVEVQPQAQLQQEPEPPAAPGRCKKMNKHELAEWLEAMGVEEDDVKKLRDGGVNEILFLRLKEGDKFLNGISHAFLQILDVLKAELRSLA